MKRKYVHFSLIFVSTLDFYCYARAWVFFAQAELICGCKMENIVDDAKNAACKLKSMGVKLPVITIGDRGVVFLPRDSDVPVHLDVEHVRAVDTTVKYSISSNK